MLYLSFMTLVTLFLYMVAELSAIGQVVNALTSLDGLPVMIVQCVITTIYTCKLRVLGIQKNKTLLTYKPPNSPRRFPHLLCDGQHPRRNGNLPHHHRRNHNGRQNRHRHLLNRDLGPPQTHPLRLATPLHPPHLHPHKRFLSLGLLAPHLRLQNR